jgi:hypothetical protein
MTDWIPILIGAVLAVVLVLIVITSKRRVDTSDPTVYVQWHDTKTDRDYSLRSGVDDAYRLLYYLIRVESVDTASLTDGTLTHKFGRRYPGHHRIQTTRNAKADSDNHNQTSS